MELAKLGWIVGGQLSDFSVCSTSQRVFTDFRFFFGLKRLAVI